MSHVWMSHVPYRCNGRRIWRTYNLWHTSAHHKQTSHLVWGIWSPPRCDTLQQPTATHCNTRVTKRHFILFGPPALRHTAMYCNTLQYTATHYNTLQRTISEEALRRRRAFPALQHTATQCTTLQHTSNKEESNLVWRLLRCNTLQRTATHCNACNARVTKRYLIGFERPLRCNTL